MKKRRIKDEKIKNILLNQKGMALLTTLIFVFILVTFAVALLIMTSNDTKLSALQRDSTKAFYIAEAGIERTLYDLKKDYEVSKNWNDGDNIINSHTLADGKLYNEEPFGEGTYTVYLSNLTSVTVTIKSKGVVYNKSTRYVQVDATVESLSIWDNAIFAGTGASGRVINGNVDIRGSVHILGEGLSPTDFAINMGGGALIGNNYGYYPGNDGLSDALRALIPSIGSPESLDAELRVKHGKVKLGGGAEVGKSEIIGDDYKDTVNGVYVTDGYDGDSASNVYSDNGTSNVYDLGDDITFPSLNDPYTDPDGNYYDHYAEYLDEKAFAPTIPGGNLIIGKSVDNFDYTDPYGKGSIKWDKATLTLEISGLIKVTGNIEVKKSTPSKVYNYKGKGTLYASDPAKTTTIANDLLPRAEDGGFPINAMGFISAGNLKIGGTSHIQAAGAFYAEGKVESNKQNEILGTFVSNYFDIGGQVPSIYQVPALAASLPPFMPGATITYTMYTSNWQEVHE